MPLATPSRSTSRPERKASHSASSFSPEFSPEPESPCSSGTYAVTLRSPKPQRQVRFLGPPLRETPDEHGGSDAEGSRRGRQATGPASVGDRTETGQRGAAWVPNGSPLVPHGRQGRRGGGPCSTAARAR